MSVAAIQRPSAGQGEGINVIVTVQLSHAIQGHSGPISSLSLREPTFGDWIDCGPLTRQIAYDPRASSEMKIEISEDQNALMRWMIRLSGQGEAILRQLGSRDAHAIRRELEAIVNEFTVGASPGAGHQ